ncbi:hypothetical protein [Parafrankia sp. EUN1f]|uniref:hypothetical protein n=1 Tax=Parafrankia sp. EUN1f TaxID=102897 RepID=UPI0001C46D0B|nr:hypothetical protein [Parafrankia sp. EUN1f]EFC80186.1 hypothetical protein FrEUN1fDRAFT_6715 [Parafrankia sp. EUN1f]
MAARASALTRLSDGKKCGAATTTGGRCKNNLKPGQSRCWRHKNGGAKPTPKPSGGPRVRWYDERGKQTKNRGVEVATPSGRKLTVFAGDIRQGDVLAGYRVEKVELGSTKGTVRVHVGNGVRMIGRADQPVDIVRGGDSGASPGDPTVRPSPGANPAKLNIDDARRRIAELRAQIGNPADIGWRNELIDGPNVFRIRLERDHAELERKMAEHREVIDLIERGHWNKLARRDDSSDEYINLFQALSRIRDMRESPASREYALASLRNSMEQARKDAAEHQEAIRLMSTRRVPDVSDHDEQIPGDDTLAKVDAIRRAGELVMDLVERRTAELVGDPDHDPDGFRILTAARRAAFERRDAIDANLDPDGFEEADQAAAAASKAYTDYMRIRIRMVAQRPEAQRDILSRLRPFGGALDYADSVSPAGKRTVDAALRNFPAEWVDRARGRQADVVTFDELAGRNLPVTGRAYYSGKGNRIVVRDGDTRIATHELTHMMEERVPGLAAAQWAYHAYRNTSEEVDGKRTWSPAGQKMRLADAAPDSAYRNDEITRRDSFVNPYTGKVYSEGPDALHWEVASMGSESFESDHSVIRNDPDLAVFILRLWATL